MTQKNARELLPFITAFAAGKTIECRSFGDTWLTLNDAAFTSPPEDYRIKPQVVFINVVDDGGGMSSPFNSETLAESQRRSGWVTKKFIEVMS